LIQVDSVFASPLPLAVAVAALSERREEIRHSHRERERACNPTHRTAAAASTRSSRGFGSSLASPALARVTRALKVRLGHDE
jgi:hypothetical protein